MTDDKDVAQQPLQFDRVIPKNAAQRSPNSVAVVCQLCDTPVDTEYYDVNGTTCCPRCRTRVESASETPRGIVPLARASAFGLGAGIVGAAIYYAVIAIARLEIGIVAILIGYMVGYAVRKGARGRGGLRFQILAVALTYASVGFAYTPIAIKAMMERDRAERTAASTAGGSSRPAATHVAPSADARPPATPGRWLLGLALLLLFILSLPMFSVFGSLPTSLIGGVIIFVGLRQAWRMTAAPRLQTLGPYRIGADSALTSV